MSLYIDILEKVELKSVLVTLRLDKIGLLFLILAAHATDHW